MSKILQHLYLGSMIEAYDINWLNRNNIKNIVNCSIETPSYYGNRFNYLNLKLYDHPSQSIRHVLDLTYNFIDRSIEKGENVFVHCVAGISRSTTIILNYIMRKYGMKYNDALTFVRNKRNIVNPNQGFRDQLAKIY